MNAPACKNKQIDNAGAHFDAGDPPMISSLIVENFRCFKNLRVDDFSRFNIVVGTNGGGKTALLEALYLPGGGPSHVFQCFNWRGILFPELQPNRVSYELLWRDIFFQSDFSNAIQVSITGTPENHRQARIFFDASGNGASTPDIPGLNPPTSERYGIIPIVFEIRDSADHVYLIHPKINEDGRYEQIGSSPEPVASFIPSSFATNANEVAGLFSELSKDDKEGDVVLTLQSVFPNIEKITVEVVPGNRISLYCSSVGNRRKMPVALISSGINKLLHILLNIASTEGGAVFIDEIENGFHYQVMPKVWDALIKFCDKYKVQLFASTHSRECLDNLEPATAERNGDFRLLRAEENNRGEHEVKVFSGKVFAAALKTGTEFR